MTSATPHVEKWLDTTTTNIQLHLPPPSTNNNQSARLTRGAFGEISLGISIHNNNNNPKWKFCAVKTIWNATVGGGKFSTTPPTLSPEVFSEILALQQLQSHPNIVQLLSAKPSDTTSLQLVLEYCPIDLYTALEWRRRTLQGPLSLSILQRLAHDLLAALDHCHSCHIVHGDVKPGNLLIAHNGTLKLCDFGLAQPYFNKEDTTKHNFSQNPNHRQQPKGLCTLWYRPPELLLGDTATTPHVDMFSAGLVVAELLHNGIPLLRGDNVLGQLSVMFDLLGTPTPESWPDYHQLPDAGKLEFVPQPPQSLVLRLPRAKEAPWVLPLLQNLLQLNPQQRWSASQCLQQFTLESANIHRHPMMRTTLIPLELRELPLLLSNPQHDMSLAHRHCVKLATSHRTLLANCAKWKNHASDNPSNETLQKRCHELCPGLVPHQS